LAQDLLLSISWVIKVFLFLKTSLFVFLAFVFMTISYLGLGSVKEPVEEVHKTHLSFRKVSQESI